MTTLELRDVTFSYGPKKVVDAVSLTCQPGEVLVLLGANGAGKTTLLHLIAGRVKPERGQVLIDDVDHATLSRRSLARQVALMLQHENRDSMLCVEEVVSLGRLPAAGWWAPFSREDQQHVEDALQATGLTAFKQRRIDQLSGGEWRRMILARALVQQAPVLLLDEPIAGLDLKYQFEMLQHIRHITQQRNLTTLVTLHDLNLAATFASRIALMHNGKLLTAGQPADTLTAGNIRQAFGIGVNIMQHPVYDTPLVVPDMDDVEP